MKANSNAIENKEALFNAAKKAISQYHEHISKVESSGDFMEIIFTLFGMDNEDIHYSVYTAKSCMQRLFVALANPATSKAISDSMGENNYKDLLNFFHRVLWACDDLEQPMHKALLRLWELEIYHTYDGMEVTEARASEIIEHYNTKRRGLRAMKKAEVDKSILPGATAN
jgi:hypothetical protein